jgi:choline-sulfatase
MPNVLLITSDQHNPFFCGFAGDPLVHTPTLDALANTGTVFDSAYTNSPICMPARASLATGRYGSTIGSYDNGSPYTASRAESFGHRARAGGHAAVTFGKLHFDPDSDSGFDMHLPLQAKPGYIGARQGWMRGDAPPGDIMVQHTLDATTGPSEYELYDRHTTGAACHWLAREAPQDTPWVAHVSYAYPHYPYRTDPAFLPADDVEIPMPPAWRSSEWPHAAELDAHRRLMRYEERPLTEDEIRQLRWIYAGMVNFLDRQISEVLAVLDHAGIADETIVIYTSDHGDMLGSHGFVMKSVMYDAAARVPLVVRGPGVPAGQRRSTAVSLVDVAPTVLDALEVTLGETGHDLPGRSLIELAGNPGDTKRIAFSEYHGPSSTGASYLIRQGGWKYVRHIHGEDEQLFNIEDDPDELVDLIDQPEHEAVRAELRQALTATIDPVETDARIRAEQQEKLQQAASGTAPSRRDGPEPRTALGTLARGWTVPPPEIMEAIS